MIYQNVPNCHVICLVYLHLLYCMFNPHTNGTHVYFYA